MARIRTIKPDFWTDEKIVELKPFARLLFIGLWNLCDDHGRMEYSPKRIKLQLFPADKLDIAQTCGELREIGLIHIYSIQGRDYIQVINFPKHQQIKDGDRASKYPEPLAQICAENPANLPQIAQSSQEGKGREGKGKDQGKEEEAPPDPVEEIFSYWQTELGHEQAKLGDDRLKPIKARLKEGYTVERIKQAVRGIKNCPHNMGVNEQKVRYDDIELICRNGKNVDRFADMERPKEIPKNSYKPPSPLTPEKQAAADRARKEAMTKILGKVG